MIADQRRRLNERSRIGMCSGDLKFDTNGIEMTIQRLDGVQYERLFFSDDSRRRGRLKHTENLIQKMSLYHDDFLRQIDRVE